MDSYFPEFLQQDTVVDVIKTTFNISLQSKYRLTFRLGR